MLSIFKRVHWIILAGIIGLVVALLLVLRSQESPQIVGTRFMDALARHDAEALAAISYSPSKDKEQLKKDWEDAVNETGRYYRFKWSITGMTLASDKNAAVRMMVERNYGISSSYEEKFELPMINVNGKWLVAVGQINRKLFPGLPR